MMPMPISQNNVGLWDVSPQPDMLRVKLLGLRYYTISLDSGKVIKLPVY